MSKEAYTTFINFFKKHNLYNKEVFEYLEENSTLFDYLDIDMRPYIGYHYIFDCQKKLKEITIICTVH